MVRGSGDRRAISGAMARVLGEVAAVGGTGLPEDCIRACARVLGLDGVGIALATGSDGDRGTEPLWSGGELMRALEDLEFTLGEGPGMDARDGSLVLEPDLAPAVRSRWPLYGPAAAALGARAVFGFPLQIGAIQLGVLVGYRSTPGSLTMGQLADALVFGDAVATLLLESGPPARAWPPWPDDPVLGRARVHQATGMVSAQLGVGLSEALVRLRAHAFATGRPVAEVAGDVVERRLRLEPAGPDNDEQASSAPEGVT